MIRRLASVRVNLFSWQGVAATVVAAGIGLTSAGIVYRALGGE